MSSPWLGLNHRLDSCQFDPCFLAKQECLKISQLVMQNKSNCGITTSNCTDQPFSGMSPHCFNIMTFQFYYYLPVKKLASPNVLFHGIIFKYFWSKFRIAEICKYYFNYFWFSDTITIVCLVRKALSVPKGKNVWAWGTLWEVQVSWKQKITEKQKEWNNWLWKIQS